MRVVYGHEKLFMGNKLVLLCILFTVNTVIQAVMVGINGVNITFNLAFVISNLVIVSAPILPIAVLDFLLSQNYIDENSFWVRNAIYIHYPISLGLLLSYFVAFALINSHYINISMIIRTAVEYTVVYIGIVLSAMAIVNIQTSNANKELKVIHASQKNNKESDN